MWPQLSKAKQNMQEIIKEIDEILKKQNSLTKKELAYHKEILLSDFDEASAVIEEKLKEFESNLESHRKQLKAKSDFLKRHNYSVRSGRKQ